LLTNPEVDLSLWCFVFYFQIWFGDFHSLLIGLLDCLDWVLYWGTCFDACMSDDVTHSFRLHNKARYYGVIPSLITQSI